MLRTINVKFDNIYVLQVAVSGSDILVKKLTEDVWFNSMVRNGLESLVKDKIAKKIKETE